MDEARAWADEGLIPSESLPGIEERYAAVIRDDEPSLAMRTFYAIGGVLLGAAVFALFAVLQSEGLIAQTQAAAWLLFLAAAIVLGAIGAGLVLSGRMEVGDAVLLAALLPAVALAGPEAPGTEALALLAPLAAGGVLVWRRHRVEPALGGLLGLEVALPLALGEHLRLSEATGTMLWFLGALAIAAGVVWLARGLAWRPAGVAVATGGLCIGIVAAIAENLPLATEGATAAVVGVAFLAVLFLALSLREVAALFVAGHALVIDAVVFAFQLGGPVWGLVALVVLAGGMFATAGRLRTVARRLAAA